MSGVVRARRNEEICRLRITRDIDVVSAIYGNTVAPIRSRPTKIGRKQQRGAGRIELPQEGIRITTVRGLDRVY